MIQLYSGTPGSGKSLHTAKDIFWYSGMKDKLIICNFPVVTDKLKHPENIVYLSNDQLVSPQIIVDLALDWFKDHERKENSIVLIIDECQLLFNSRSWNEDGRKQWISFFTQHRKLGFMVILVAQFVEMVDKQIRSLIEYETVHRKITNFGNLGFLLKCLFMYQDIFIGVEKWYSVNEKIGQTFFLARKKYYTLYDTFNTFDTSNDFSL